MLEARSVHFGYGDEDVVSDVSMEVRPGRVAALLGPNGSGKTTLLRLLLGHLTPRSGEVTLDGRPIGSMGARARARRVAFIPHHATVAFAYTVREVVSFAFNASSDRARDEGMVDAVLERLDLQEHGTRSFLTLSAGQRARVAIARAVLQVRVAGCSVLLADEPCARLDPRHALLAVELFRELASSGLAVVVIEHDLSRARRLADDAHVLASGSTVRSGEADAVLTPETLGSTYGVRFRVTEDAVVPLTVVDVDRRITT